MPVLDAFCFVFSVRLGSIVIGSLTLSCIWIGICILLIGDQKKASDLLFQFFEDVQLNLEFFQTLADDPIPLLVVAILFFGTLTFSCGILIAGCLKCKLWMLYQFLFMYVFYILYLTLIDVTLMLHLKHLEVGIGDLILYSNLGAFVLIYFIYTWLCVVSFLQIVKEMRGELDRRKLFEKSLRSGKLILTTQR